MDIIAAKPYAGLALKFKICRFLQMGVDALSLVLSGVVLISAIIVCNSSKGGKGMQGSVLGMQGSILGKLLAWPLLLFFILFHSGSGVIFYFTKRRCKSEESWKIIYVTCNLSTSMIIQFAYLLGSHPVHGLAKNNGMCIGRLGGAGSSEKAVSSIIAVAEAVCQIASIVHFVAAFFPPPMYLVDVDSSSGSHEAIELDEMEAVDTIQLGKSRVSFSADPAAESPPLDPTEQSVPPENPVL